LIADKKFSAVRMSRSVRTIILGVDRRSGCKQHMENC